MSGCRGIGIYHSQLVEINHVRHDMDHSARNDGPRSGFMQGDTFVEGNNVIKWGATEQRDEIAADREENEDDVDMKNESSCSSDS